MLQLVSHDRRMDRLRVAAAHIEAAIAHINNEAQVRVPGSTHDDPEEVTTLRLLVVALSDIRIALERQSPAFCESRAVTMTDAVAN
jgi:hypothetical protein